MKKLALIILVLLFSCKHKDKQGSHTLGRPIKLTSGLFKAGNYVSEIGIDSTGGVIQPDSIDIFMKKMARVFDNVKNRKPHDLVCVLDVDYKVWECDTCSHTSMKKCYDAICFKSKSIINDPRNKLLHWKIINF